MPFDLKTLKAQPGLLHEMPGQALAQLQGEVLALYLASERYRDAPVSELAAFTLPAIHFNQFRIYRNETGPIGWVSWAYFSDENASGYMAGDFDFDVSCWQSGPHLWFIDYIAPFGHALKMAEDLKRNVFPNQVGFAPDLEAEDGSKRVRKFFGARVTGRDTTEDNDGFVSQVGR